MTEPTDVILPILQRMQGDNADLKREVAELKRQMISVRAAQTVAKALPPSTGGVDMLTGKSVAAIRKEGEAVKARLIALESRP